MNQVFLHPEHDQADWMGHRSDRMDAGSTTHPVANVIGRLVLWFVLTFAAMVAWLSAVMSTLSFGVSTDPPPAPDLGFVIAVPVFFLLSLAPILGPGAPQGLRVFGVVWAFCAGMLVSVAVASLV